MTLSSRKIYISHSPADSEVANALANKLERDGYPIIFRDSDSEGKSMKAGDVYTSIETARALIVILSADSIQDENVKREINLAIDKKLDLYPLNFTGEQIKKLLTPEWRYWLGITQILSCDDASHASRTLRFRIPADSAAAFSKNANEKESIKGAWRTFETIFDEVGNAKLNHFHMDFDQIHKKFCSEVVPGFSLYAKELESTSLELKVENRFAGKMIYGLFNYLQYFDCHSLTLNRSSNCGLRGHEIETLVANYIKFAACNFEYPSAITWYAESQFLWDFEEFLASALPLLSEAMFPISIDTLNLDFEGLYANYAEDDFMVEGLDYKPSVGLSEHVFDYLSKCVFYKNVSILSNKNTLNDNLNTALRSIDSFLDEFVLNVEETVAAAPLRERFQMDGYPMLLVLRAFLLDSLERNEESSLAIDEICKEDLRTLNYFMPRNIQAANGQGKAIIESLWTFLCEQVDFGEVDSGILANELEGIEEGLDSEDRSYSVAEQLFLLGIRFEGEGDIDRAMDLWSRAARAGVVSGLGSFTWASLKLNEFKVAIDLYEECIDIPTDSIYALEKMNCTGNYILNVFALDKDHKAAIERLGALLRERDARDLTEVKAMLATFEYLYGDQVKAREIFHSIPTEELAQFEQSYELEATSESGWLKDWCSNSLVALSNLKN